MTTDLWMLAASALLNWLLIMAAATESHATPRKPWG
jgi:hypothetical protein